MNPYFVYLAYPFPFMIPILKMGIYARGKYHVIEADQFTSKWSVKLTATLLLSGSKLPNNHNCKSCAKTCRNVTIYDYCCDYEQMDGIEEYLIR